MNLRALVVDDSYDDFLLLIRTLTHAGFKVLPHAVQTEAEMLAALEERTWDIVFVDWVLPQFSAPDALRILRERPGQIPCIVVSGSCSPDVAVLAIQLGARDFITKENLDAVPTAVRRELMFSESEKSNE